MIDLFHRIVDAGSARVRRHVVDRELVEAVRFRNIDFDGPAADFAKLGGSTVPALWDGERLSVGADAVIARLDALKDVGR